MFIQEAVNMLYQMAASVGFALELGIILCFVIVAVFGVSIYKSYK